MILASIFTHEPQSILTESASTSQLPEWATTFAVADAVVEEARIVDPAEVVVNVSA
jgi:hypothetical protein